MSDAITKIIHLSPEEGAVLEQMSRKEHLPEGALLKKLVLEGLARRRLEWACQAYAGSEVDISGAAGYAGISVYEMLDELKQQEIELVSPEQFLDGLVDLAELFEMAELREVASEVRASS